MSYKPRYNKGDWIADCDVCGRKFKASQLQQRWDGLMCCPLDWEIRQPQDFVKGVPDPQLVPWIRDEPADTFISFNWTQQNNESLTLTESLSFNFNRAIRDVLGDTINGSVLNGFALNHTSTQTTTMNDIGISETFSFGLSPHPNVLNGSKINTSTLG